MSSNSDQTTNQGLDAAKKGIQTGANAGKKGARAGKNAAKLLKKGKGSAAAGAGMKKLIPPKAKAVAVGVLVLVVIIAILVEGMASSSTRRTYRQTAINEDQTINYPETAEEEQESIYSRDVAVEDTVSMADIVHTARTEDREFIEKQIDDYIEKARGRTQFDAGGTKTIDEDVTRQMIQRDDGEYIEAYIVDNYESGDSTIRILMVNNNEVADAEWIEMLKGFGADEVVCVYDAKDINANYYDALCIPGGNNIDPSVYNEPNTNATRIDKDKDLLQIEAVKKFAAKRKPILGVCRGCQLLNVAFGGTIDQDISNSTTDENGYHNGYR